MTPPPAPKAPKLAKLDKRPVTVPTPEGVAPDAELVGALYKPAVGDKLRVPTGELLDVTAVEAGRIVATVNGSQYEMHGPVTGFVGLAQGAVRLSPREFAWLLEDFWRGHPHPTTRRAPLCAHDYADVVSRSQRRNGTRFKVCLACRHLPAAKEGELTPNDLHELVEAGRQFARIADARKGLSRG